MKDLRLLLRTSGFGVLLSGTFLSSVGSLVHVSVTSWLLFQLTGSSAMVGLLTVAQFGPMVALTLPAGVLADHQDRRRFLIWVQGSMMVLAFTLATLVRMDLAAPWTLLVVTAGLGAGMALVGPTWMAYVTDIVPPDKALLGFSMNSVCYHLAAAVGPPIGVAILVAFGPATGYFVNGVSYLAIIAALMAVRTPSRLRGPFPGLRRSMLEVVAFARGSQRAKRLLPASSAIAVVAFGFVAALPAYAVDVLGGSERSYGRLMGAVGLGSLTGAILMGYLPSRAARRTIIVSGAWLIAAGMALMALTRSTPTAMAGMVGMGAGQLMLLVTARTVVQLDAPDRLRARAVSLWFACSVGFGTLAGLGVGWSVDRWGVTRVVGGAAVYALLCAMLLTIAARSRAGRIAPYVDHERAAVPHLSGARR